MNRQSGQMRARREDRASIPNAALAGVAIAGPGSPHLAQLAAKLNQRTAPQLPSVAPALVQPARAGDGAAANAQGIVQLCRTGAEVIGEGLDFAVQKELLLAYLDELDGSINGFIAQSDDDGLYDAADVLFRQIADLQKYLRPATDSIDTYVEMSDSITEGYAKLKAFYSGGSSAASSSSSGGAADEAGDVGEGGGFDVDVDMTVAKKLGLKGNSRPIRKSTVTRIGQCAATLRSLKQALLNDATAGAASLTLTEEYQSVKSIVETAAQQSNPTEVREYWTMKRGGLVAGLAEAEELFRAGVVCNEELAALLERFLENKFEYF